jgi:heat shock protein HslJ
MLSVMAATGLGLVMAVSTTSLSFAAGGTAGRDTAGHDTAARSAAADACQDLDFDTATVTQVPATDGAAPAVRNRLTVTGTKPATNVYVGLRPVKHIAQPEYWMILVTGCSSGVGLPVVTPYTATYDFSWSMGSCGIEVVGATRSQRFDLAGCHPIPLTGTRWVLDPTSLGTPVPAGATVTANFSATSVSGSTSCNTYMARYSVGADGAWTIGPIAMTARACEPAIAAVERAFLSRLAKAKQVQATSTRLQLRADGQTLLRFTPAPVVTRG